MNLNNTGPVVIGGIGGSGTRLVARIVSSLNVFMGNDLNKCEDNLLYTLLFKRSRWFKKNRNNEKEIEKGIQCLNKFMINSAPLTFQEISFLLKAALEISLKGHNHYQEGKYLWPLKRIIKIMENRFVNKEDYLAWGWKEPNSHLILNDLNRYYDHLKYIHVIRHGLDMAFSPNQQQLFNWGEMFGIHQPIEKTELPNRSLEFWIKVNKEAIGTGKKMGEERFLLVDYDKLCDFPEVWIEKICSFIHIHPGKDRLGYFLEIPKKTISSGRFRKQDLSVFHEEYLTRLEEFGYRL